MYVSNQPPSQCCIQPQTKGSLLWPYVQVAIRSKEHAYGTINTPQTNYYGPPFQLINHVALNPVKATILAEMEFDNAEWERQVRRENLEKNNDSNEKVLFFRCLVVVLPHGPLSLGGV
jgi:hypothetical protein